MCAHRTAFCSTLCQVDCACRRAGGRNERPCSRIHEPLPKRWRAFQEKLSTSQQPMHVDAWVCLCQLSVNDASNNERSALSLQSALVYEVIKFCKLVSVHSSTRTIQTKHHIYVCGCDKWILRLIESSISIINEFTTIFGAFAIRGMRNWARVWRKRSRVPHCKC